jgi:hypothetical protein
MSTKDEEKLRRSRRKLSWLDDETTEVINDKSLSDLLKFRAPPPKPDDAPDKRASESENNSPNRRAPGNATLEFDSEAWVEDAPVSEAGPDLKKHTPATLEVHLRANDLREMKTRVRPAASVDPPRRHRSLDEASRSAATGPHRGARESSNKKPARSVEHLHTEDLRPVGVAAYKKWKLSETPLTGILLSLAGAGDATVLELRAGKNRAQIVVSGGELHEVRLLPCSTKRSLTASLVKKGRLNPAQAASVREFARKRSVSEAQALLQAGNLLPAAEVRAAVRARMRHILNRLMEANLVEASAFRLDAVPAGLRVAPLSLVGILFGRVRAYYEGPHQKAREQAEQRLVGMQLIRKSNFAFSINHLNLPIHERQLIDRVLTRRRSYDGVLRNSPTSKNTTIAILAGLEAVGLLRVDPPGLSNYESSSWVDDYTMAVARIDSMEARLSRENHFDLFGLHWSTYDVEIERAYNELSSHFSLLHQPLGLTNSQRKRLEAIRAKLQKIYDILRDPKRRGRYRRTFVPPAHCRRAAQKFDGLGAAAFRKRAFHSALDYYQRVLSLEPNNSSASRLLPILLARTTSRRS